MISLPRGLNDKGFFHVMVQGLNKEYIFNRDDYKIKYINLIKEYKNKYNILVLAYCMMDNHAHLLIYTEKVAQLSTFMQNINSKYALFYNKEKGRVGYVFRGRFNSEYIDSVTYLLRCLNYIHMNPVKANMVKAPKDYKYSTYNDYLNKKGIVDDVVLNKIFGTESNYLNIFLNISNVEIEIMDVDRENKNLEIAIKFFEEKHDIKISEIKEDKKLLKEFCREIILNKGYKQANVRKFLKIGKSKMSKAVKECQED